jgi:hypothetical protein
LMNLRRADGRRCSRPIRCAPTYTASVVNAITPAGYRLRALLQKLSNRTEAAVELKHQNISAILMEHGWQNIPGYKPLGIKGAVFHIPSE